MIELRDDPFQRTLFNAPNLNSRASYAVRISTMIELRDDPFQRTLFNAPNLNSRTCLAPKYKKIPKTLRSEVSCLRQRPEVLDLHEGPC